jgi:hypothetical protein
MSKDSIEFELIGSVVVRSRCVAERKIGSGEEIRSRCHRPMYCFMQEKL